MKLLKKLWSFFRRKSVGCLQGEIDNLHIFDFALNDKEILLLYDGIWLCNDSDGKALITKINRTHNVP